MTFERFLGFGALFAVSSAAVYVIFTKYIALSPSIHSWVIWALIFLLAVAFTRRLGDMSYLEGLLVSITWLSARMFLDLLITVPLLGGIIFYKNWTIWISYIIIGLSIFLLHKKRHVAIRKHLKEHHHGH